MTLFIEHPLAGNEQLLDLGCGDGKITNAIAQQLTKGRIIGIDNSMEMIKFARDNYTQPNLNFEHYDAEKLLHYERQFDLITCSFVIQWIKNKTLVFQGIEKCLKPNGKLIFIAPIKQPITAKIRKNMLQSTYWQPYFEGYQDPTLTGDNTHYREYAIAAKLDIRNYKEENTTTMFNNIHALTHFFIAITPHINHLKNDQLKNLFINELIEAYIKEVPPIQDKFPVTFKYISFAGHKMMR